MQNDEAVEALLSGLTNVFLVFHATLIYELVNAD
jgi:hypothetical protein